MPAEHSAEYREYVTARMDAMRRFAYLTCGDWHRAEDAVQTAFVKLYQKWHLASRASLDAYTRRIVVNTLIDEYRRGWFRRERPSERPPDVPHSSDDAERLTVLQALGELPTRRRATLVLRYWEDLTVEQTAEVLGCSVHTVKSQTARGLQTLRGLLSEVMPETTQGVRR